MGHLKTMEGQLNFKGSRGRIGAGGGGGGGEGESVGRRQLASSD